MKSFAEQKALSFALLPELSNSILNLISAHTKATLSDLLTLTKANRNTIKKHLQDLVKKGLLKKHGVRKGTWYTR